MTLLTKVRSQKGPDDIPKIPAGDADDEDVVMTQQTGGSPCSKADPLQPAANVSNVVNNVIDDDELLKASVPESPEIQLPEKVEHVEALPIRVEPLVVGAHALAKAASYCSECLERC